MKTTSTKLDRRIFLTSAAAAAGLAALGAPLRAAPPSTIPPPRPRHVRVARVLATAEAPDWLAWVGTDFRADTEIGAVTLRLVSVDAVSADPNRPATLARSGGFFAVFAPPAGIVPAGDRIYRLSSTGLAPMDVYFSAAAGNLTAVFN
jgi:hypothetical protein